MSAKQSVVLTGASTGIGWATAKVLLDKGFRVFGTVRKQSDADRLSAEFGKDFVPLLADVTDEAAVQQAATLVGEMLGKERLAGLVNNAGIVVGGPLLHLDPSEMRRQMEVNLIGPFLVTKAFAPLLGSDPARSGKPGRIVQISSVSGKMGVPFVGAYSASKFALEGMSESLRRELLLYGIDVIIVGPGAVITPIWDKAQAEDFSRFDATDYGPIIQRFLAFFAEEGKKGLAAEEIGHAIHRALTVSKPKVRYAVVPQRFKNWTLPNLLSKRMVDRILGKQFGLMKK
ncbi:SDR family oxidoreductase [Granulicella tundricola]|uniref:Short-chain dehydrogenase/reductase SDR n=1 Tax=Granulicella tundricola (strain ATCC BAA-1859 / DSM 23138 / MP5ACTX9) TaxID=1198114 RepID=E8X6U3_GRATM|nr:SDR family oxidoreductase [Granulicella tundricola]ADW71243.1 short-chain dehydrogenase/reductase SDR [Granulicella tundricola MP5ACTX9]